MRHSFSAEFLRVMSPDTTFGNAWESLCFDLLAAEHGHTGLQRLNAPDSGIDILRKTTETAIQCKSDERGAFGSLSAAESVKSLKAAIGARPEIAWRCYTYATNANYTGSALKTLLGEAANLGIDPSTIEFLGPEYWNEMCEKYWPKVADRFDLRVTVTESQVIEAFRKARYFDSYVNEYAGLIAKGAVVLKIKNNLTPVELEIPFAPDLTVENCVDVVQELLGISLKWTNFADLGTSARLAISLTIDRHAQAFKQAIGELLAASGDKDPVFWITLVWKDEKQTDGLAYEDQCLRMNLSFAYLDRLTVGEFDRKKHTLERAETLIETTIWEAARRLKNPETSVTTA